jgi:hypothetical protein
MVNASTRWTFFGFLWRISLFLTGVSTIGFSLIGALFRGPSEGVPAGARYGLIWAAAAIVFFAVANYFGQWQMVRRYGRTSDYNPRQSRTVIVNASLQKVLASIEAGLLELPWIIPDSLARSEGTIRAVTRVNLRSFAEEISISGTPENGDKTLLVIESRPRSWGTMADYGKGIENVEELTRAIQQWLGLPAESAQPLA